LSTTEAEYVALSQALRETIPLMQLLDELRTRDLGVPELTPLVHCRLFEDNSGAIEMVRVPKMRPRTKHINVKYHHFREYVRTGKVVIEAVGTGDQIADIFTKPLPQDVFARHRAKIMGW
jgi:hypothetical protein